MMRQLMLSRLTIRFVWAGVCPILRPILLLLLAILFGSSSAFAVGFGPLQMQSALGQPFHAQIKLIGSSGSEIENRCFKVKLTSLDGVALGVVNLNVQSEATTPVIDLSTLRPVDEPAALVSIEYNCKSLTSRDYQVLLDFPKLDNVVSSTRITPAAASKNKKSVAVASDQSSSVEKTPSDADTDTHTKKSRHHRNNDGDAKPAADKAQAPLASTDEIKEKPVQKAPAKVMHNVLRLGSDDGLDSYLNDTKGMHLALSHNIGEMKNSPEEAAMVAPSGTTAPPAATTAATGSANASMASAPVVDPELQALQGKIHTLEAQANELKKLNSKQLADLESARKNKSTNDRVNYLYILLAVCVVAIAWLIWRTRKIQTEMTYSSWQQVVPESDIADEDDDPHHVKNFLEDDDEDFLPGIKNITPIKVQSDTEQFDGPEADLLIREPLAGHPVAAPEEGGEGDYKFLSNIRTTLPNAEEILDEIQQAEFWMDMQQPQRAIEILESNWGVERPSSPLPWLYLFDLYRMVADKEKYDELTERFELIFNGKVIPWGDGDALPQRSLEEFPFLMKKITQLWHSEELVPFLENLLIDDRDGRRQGFDLAAYRDILFLVNIAYEIEGPKSHAKDADPNMIEWSVLN